MSNSQDEPHGDFTEEESIRKTTSSSQKRKSDERKRRRKLYENREYLSRSSLSDTPSLMAEALGGDFGTLVKPPATASSDNKPLNRSLPASSSTASTTTLNNDSNTTRTTTTRPNDVLINFFSAKKRLPVASPGILPNNNDVSPETMMAPVSPGHSSVVVSTVSSFDQTDHPPPDETWLLALKIDRQSSPPSLPSLTASLPPPSPPPSPPSPPPSPPSSSSSSSSSSSLLLPSEGTASSIFGGKTDEQTWLQLLSRSNASLTPLNTALQPIQTFQEWPIGPPPPYRSSPSPPPSAAIPRPLLTEMTFPDLMPFDNIKTLDISTTGAILPTEPVESLHPKTPQTERVEVVDACEPNPPPQTKPETPSSAPVDGVLQDSKARSKAISDARKGKRGGQIRSLTPPDTEHCPPIFNLPPARLAAPNFTHDAVSNTPKVPSSTIVYNAPKNRDDQNTGGGRAAVRSDVTDTKAVPVERNPQIANPGAVESANPVLPTVTGSVVPAKAVRPPSSNISSGGRTPRFSFGVLQEFLSSTVPVQKHSGDSRYGFSKLARQDGRFDRSGPHHASHPSEKSKAGEVSLQGGCRTSGGRAGRDDGLGMQQSRSTDIPDGSAIIHLRPRAPSSSNGLSNHPDVIVRHPSYHSTTTPTATSDVSTKNTLGLPAAAKTDHDNNYGNHRHHHHHGQQQDRNTEHDSNIKHGGDDDQNRHYGDSRHHPSIQRHLTPAGRPVEYFQSNSSSHYPPPPRSSSDDNVNTSDVPSKPERRTSRPDLHDPSQGQNHREKDTTFIATHHNHGDDDASEHYTPNGLPVAPAGTTSVSNPSPTFAAQRNTPYFHLQPPRIPKPVKNFDLFGPNVERYVPFDYAVEKLVPKRALLEETFAFTKRYPNISETEKEAVNESIVACFRAYKNYLNDCRQFYLFGKKRMHLLREIEMRQDILTEQAELLQGQSGLRKVILAELQDLMDQVQKMSVVRKNYDYGELGIGYFYMRQGQEILQPE